MSVLRKSVCCKEKGRKKTMPRKTKIQEVRVSLGISQAELARRAGINQTSLSRIENGQEPAFPKRGKKIADALGWSGDPDELFEFIEKEDE